MRSLLRIVGALAALGTLAACGSSSGSGPYGLATPAYTTSSSSTSPTTQAVGTSCSGKATPAVTEGPYFKAGSPLKTDLVDAATAGTRLTLVGHVLTTACNPVGAATLDFWQADSGGNYDNSGYRLRGHQLTDASGAYQLATIIPGLYPGRTEHIHVKVSAPGKAVLTIQLFFPGVAQNSQDGIFNPSLLITLTDAAAGKAGSFNFVVS